MGRFCKCIEQDFKNLWQISLFILGACTTTDSFLEPQNQGNFLIGLLKMFLSSPERFSMRPIFPCRSSQLLWKNISPSQIAERYLRKKSEEPFPLIWPYMPRDQGFVAEWYTGDVKDLRENIDNNRPLIAMVDLGLGPVQKPHYLVVVGYDPKVLLSIPGLINTKLVPWNRFQNQWNRSELMDSAHSS
jgi:hypothetical protein